MASQLQSYISQTKNLAKFTILYTSNPIYVSIIIIGFWNQLWQNISDIIVIKVLYDNQKMESYSFKTIVCKNHNRTWVIHPKLPKIIQEYDCKT